MIELTLNLVEAQWLGPKQKLRMIKFLRIFFKNSDFMTSWFHWLHIKFMLWVKVYFLSHGSCHQSRFIHFFILFPRTYVVLLLFSTTGPLPRIFFAGFAIITYSRGTGEETTSFDHRTYHGVVYISYVMAVVQQKVDSQTNKEDLKSKFWAPFSTSMMFSGLWNFNDCHRNATQYVMVVYC